MRRKNSAVNVMLLMMSCNAISLASGNVNSTDPEVVVRVFQTGLIPGPTLHQGQIVAQRIMATAGVHVRWVYGGFKTESPVPGCASGGGAVQTIDLRFVYSTPRYYLRGALAEAFPFAQSGIRITVFFDRVSDIPKGYRIPAHLLLGHVLAHEIGHVLLQNDGHAETGLMKPRWTDVDYYQMLKEYLKFTLGDARSIQSNLASGCSLVADSRAGAADKLPQSDGPIMY